MSKNAALIEKLEGQLSELKDRVQKIKDYRKENDPEKLRKEIAEWKEKLKEQEKEMAKVKEEESKRRFALNVQVVDAIFSFPEGANVVVGME